MIKWPEPAKKIYANARNTASVRSGAEMSGYLKESYYTEDQLKQAVRDAYEEAANKCDAEVQDIHSSNESRNTAEHLAQRIRALIKEIPE
jgi:thymidylate kinase